MAVLKAAIVILLAMTPMILNALPLPQTIENIGRGRSYPVIISQYSNVRNSKYNQPGLEKTTTTTTTVKSIEVAPVEQPKAVEPVVTEDVKTDVAKTEDVKIEDVKIEDVKIEDVKIEDVKVEDVKIDDAKVDDAKVDDAKVEEAKVEDVKTETVATEEVKPEVVVKTENEPPAVVDKAEIAQAEVVDKVENVQPEVAVKTENAQAEAAEKVDNVQPQVVEKMEIAQPEEAKPIENVPVKDEVKTSETEEAAKPVETSQTSSDAVVALTDSKNESNPSVPEESLVPKDGAAEAAVKVEEPTTVKSVEAPLSDGIASQPIKEAPTTSVADEAVQPAALEKSPSPQMDTTLNAPASSVADSVAAAPVESPKVQPAEQSTDAVEKTATDGQLIASPVAESTVAQESARTAQLDPPKAEFFEEDRSFKDRPEEAILEAIRQGTLDEKLVQLAASSKTLDETAKNLDALIADETVNEGIRLERDDKKTEEKKKEKEKLLVKLNKEKKPTKPVSDDPVQEYEEPTRGARADETADQTAELSPVITLVPDNYPVILPNGESTLSDKVGQQEETKPNEKPEEPVVIGVVPGNHPVILPNGESTLSDQVKAEETKTSENGEPVVIGVVPDHHPVVLPSGESALSNKPTEAESPKEEKTGAQN